tara:strand:+ start:1080 stop:1394 length:315 start_codon:yes stop_codon:yes gene_type:complete
MEFYMKALVFFSLVFSSLSSFACQQEAQFISVVSNTQFANEKCLISISHFSQYNISAVCPLWESDVLEKGIIAKFEKSHCLDLAGRELSGYLVRPSGSETIYFD